MSHNPQRTPTDGAVPTTDARRIGTLATGATITLIGRVVGRGLDMVKQIAIARLLGPEAFGLFALAWNLLRIVVILAPLGLQNGVIHFGSAFWRRDDSAFKSLLLRSLAISMAFSLAFSVLLYALAPWISVTWFDDPQLTAVLRLFTLAIPLTVGMRMTVAATQVSQRMKFAIYIEELWQTAVSLVLFFLFYWIGWQLFGAVLATVLSFAAAFAAGLYYVYRLFPEVFASTAQAGLSIRQLLTYSLPTAAAGTFGVLVNRLNRIFIGFFLPTTAVGIYQAAAQFSVIFAIVLNGFNAIFAPLIARLYHDHDMPQLEELYRVSTKWGLYVSMPFFLVICLTPTQVMVAAFGESFASGGVPLLILTVGQLFNMASGAVGYILMMTARQNVWFTLSTAAMVLNLVLNWLLIELYGLPGAALATTIGVFFLFGLGLWYIRKSLGLWPYDRRYLKGVAAALAATVALLPIRYLTTLPLVNVLLMGVLATVVFFGVLLLLGLDAEDQMFVETLMRRIRKLK